MQWCGRTLITGGSAPHLRRFQGVVRSGETLRYDHVSELQLDGAVVSMDFDDTGLEACFRESVFFLLRCPSCFPPCSAFRVLVASFWLSFPSPCPLVGIGACLPL